MLAGLVASSVLWTLVFWMVNRPVVVKGLIVAVGGASSHTEDTPRFSEIYAKWQRPM